MEKIQKVYILQIKESSTSHSVVLKAMKRSIKIAEECGRTTIKGTYDLAIAETVMQLQEQEAPRFGKTYVSLVSYIEPVLLYSF